MRGSAGRQPPRLFFSLVESERISFAFFSLLDTFSFVLFKKEARGKEGGGEVWSSATPLPPPGLSGNCRLRDFGVVVEKGGCVFFLSFSRSFFICVVCFFYYRLRCWGVGFGVFLEGGKVFFFVCVVVGGRIASCVWGLPQD